MHQMYTSKQAGDSLFSAGECGWCGGMGGGGNPGDTKNNLMVNRRRSERGKNIETDLVKKDVFVCFKSDNTKQRSVFRGGLLSQTSKHTNTSVTTMVREVKFFFLNKQHPPPPPPKQQQQQNVSCFVEEKAQRCRSGSGA